MTAGSSASSEPTDTDGIRSRLRISFWIPLAVFLVIAAAFAVGLTLDPSKIPSVLIGKPVPEFDLPSVEGQPLGLASRNLRGEVSLVNVWASWCVECRLEHPVLMGLSQSGAVPVHGLDYKDKPADAKDWLDRLGNPYVRTGADIDGRVAIDLGVYGVPETFVIGADGIIAHKHIGAITPEVLETEILPLVRKLREGAAAKPAAAPGG